MARNYFCNVTRFLNLATAILVLWTSVDLLHQLAGRSGFTAQSSLSSNSDNSIDVSDKGDPDIYLIVLDKYTGGRSLRDNFGFENTAFEVFLVDRGFVLPRTPHANYIHTTLSLASLLNYRYLDDIPEKVGAENPDQAYVNQLVEDNAAWRFLRTRGYRFVFFPTAFPITRSNRFADLQIPDPSQIPAEFEIVWRRTTLAQPAFWWACQRVYCAHVFTPFTTEAPALLEWKFDQLKELPRWPRDGRPLFVFAHITSPHEPYVFNRDCSTRQPLWPSYYVIRDDTPEKQAYVAQLSCVNRRLESIVEHILRDSPTPQLSCCRAIMATVA